MTTSDPRRRFPVGLTLAALVVFAILCGLGTWQLNRLAWKREMLADIAAARAAAPAPLSGVLARGARGDDIDYARVTVACRNLAGAPWVEIYSLNQGAPGVRLISACPIDDAPWRTILVDRGFVAQEVSSRPGVRDDGGVATITGVLRRPEAPSRFAAERGAGGQFHSRDIAAMAAELHVRGPTAPWFLMAETSSNPDWDALRPAPLPTNVSNRHMEYAVTWFGLAAALAGVYAAMLWKRMRA